MTDANIAVPGCYPDTEAGRLGHAADEIGRARALLTTIMIVHEHMNRPDLSKAERKEINTLVSTIKDVDNILDAVHEQLSTLLAEAWKKEAA
jgi:hypothetical protein